MTENEEGDFIAQCQDRRGFASLDAVGNNALIAYLCSESTRTEILTLIAERDAMRGGWQPIETAPRNGEVLLYCAETGEQFVAFLGTNPEDGEQQWVFARSPNISFIVRDPTHWMPLPGAPAHAATSEGSAS